MKTVAAARVYMILRHCSRPGTAAATMTKEKSDITQESRSILTLPPRHMLNGTQHTAKG